MKKEIRAKINDADRVVERLIDEAGADEVDVVEQKDTYFGSIMLYEKLDRSFLVRVREEDSRVMINYKSEVEDGIWDEHETIINSPEEAKEIFDGMGLEQVLVVEKTRRSFTYEGMHIHVDSISDLGDFIEVKMNPEEHTEEEVYTLLETVGVSKDQLREEGYVSELLKRKESEYAPWCST
ncbi:MAG: class IV adenylate cyclase [Candidatus Nanohaloarchaea archaeon]|nr:class IV adenylate cyclase [Candidatus Nanohaloarchaea archaeon]